MHGQSTKVYFLAVRVADRYYTASILFYFIFFFWWWWWWEEIVYWRL